MKKKKNLQIIHTNQGFVGGAEKFIYKVSEILSKNYILNGVFEKTDTDTQIFGKYFDHISIFKNTKESVINNSQLTFVHKITNESLLAELKKNKILITFVHDHDFYCPRTTKYFPFTRTNCHRAFNVTCSYSI